VLVAVAVAGVVALVLTGVHDQWFQLFLGWAEAHESLASVVIILLYIPVALMFIPLDVPLYLCAGFMYGFYKGSLVCWIGYNVGSWFGFVAARFMFRDWFVGQTRNNRYILAIEAAVEDNATALVILLQLAPILPYSMVCYFFGTSTCPFDSFAVGTSIGVIPCVVFFVFVGSTMENLAEAAEGSIAHSNAYWVFFWISGLVGLVAVAFVGWAAKRQLDRLIDFEADDGLGSAAAVEMMSPTSTTISDPAATASPRRSGGSHAPRSWEGAR